jgi:hypothetical protein
MGDSIQGNQTFAGSSLVPAALPKASSWLQQVVDLGKRLIHKQNADARARPGPSIHLSGVSTGRRGMVSNPFGPFLNSGTCRLFPAVSDYMDRTVAQICASPKSSCYNSHGDIR